MMRKRGESEPAPPHLHVSTSCGTYDAHAQTAEKIKAEVILRQFFNFYGLPHLFETANVTTVEDGAAQWQCIIRGWCGPA